MQIKVGTILDDSLLKKAKEFAAAQHTTLNHLLEDALSEYISKKEIIPRKFSWVEASFGAMRVPKKVIKKILEEDVYEV